MDLIQSYDGEAVSSSPDSSPPDILKPQSSALGGTMSQHIPALDYYSNKLPLVSKVYASSEVFYGLNLNPLSKPQHVSYTFLPNMSYFEFIRVDADGEDTSEIVDLVDVTLGYYYEPLVTNYSGRTMSQHIPALDYYSNELPLVSKVYASSEAFFGINVNPLSKPQHVSYTFLPNMSYFEFKEVDDDGETTGEIVDLVNVNTGTSSGEKKIFPANDNFEDILLGLALSSLVMSKHVDGYKQGKVMIFKFIQPISTTPCGLPLAPSITIIMKSKCYRSPGKRSTTPDEIIMCTDPKQSMYCQLLCGLVQRDEVVSVGALFASVLVQIIRFLEKYWKELCSNIRSGHVSDWITDHCCRDSVSTILGEPNPELADLIENECGQESWQGIVSRLWPKTKCVETIVTGIMAQYIPALEFYSDKLPIVSSIYGSSETFFGLNVNPLCKPQHVSYTFLPNMSYFEFIHVDADGEATGEIVDLVDVKSGGYYEPLVTNYSGSLYRCRVGDVLHVTGFYNNAPQFRFVRRKNTVLSIFVESTTEEDVLKALDRATVALESSDLMLTGFTCFGDVSTVPGHYVFYLELKAKVNNDTNVLLLDEKVLVEYCCVMEESLSSFYRSLRRKDGPIGPLEVRVVQQGTFDSLMEFFVSRGASITQYKTPICINSVEASRVLEDKVLARFFSDKSPTI
ncbi:unnamed protein product [Brassica rapa subsp. trilocularis]